MKKQHLSKDEAFFYPLFEKYGWPDRDSENIPYYQKRIINRTTYFEKTSHQVAFFNYDGTNARMYLDRFHERLYQTRKGSFFIAGEGSNHSFWQNFGIVPLENNDLVKEWLELRNLVDEYEKLFDYDESDLTSLVLRFPPILGQKIEANAKKENKDVHEFIIDAIESNLQRLGSID